MVGKSKKSSSRETVVILPDIRSALNVGSIFRTADAAGVSKIYLTGYTTAPVDKFGRVEKQIAKTALGAEKNLPWEKASDVARLLAKLKKTGFQIVAVEQDNRSIDYKKLKIGSKTAFVFGNETDGLPCKILDKCDIMIEIPMRGQKESLNVAVSAGVVLFQALA